MNILIKRVSSILCTAALLFAAVPFSLVYAAVADFEYFITDGEARIVAYHGSDTSIKIPSSLGGCPVRRIENYAFTHSALESVTIPDTVRSIGLEAFINSASLRSVSIPEGVTSIGDKAFAGCVSLESIVLPDSLIDIGTAMFDTCSSLESAVLPKGMTAVPPSMFCRCEALHTVIFPQGLLAIGDHAFERCKALAAIQIPDGVEQIGGFAFASGGLESVKIPDSVTSIGEHAFYNCDSLTSIELSKGLTRLETYVLCECDALEYAEVPIGVTSIGRHAFSYSDSLRGVSLPVGLKTIEDRAFEECWSLRSMVLPTGLETIGTCAFSGCSAMESLVIPSSVNYIGHDAFIGCSSLKAVHVASLSKWCGITFATEFSNPMRYGDRLYVNGEPLRELVIPADVTAITPSAFRGCRTVERVVIPEGVTTLGADLFNSCEALETVVIPQSVTSIDSTAFAWCTSLKTVIYGGNEAAWEAILAETDNRYLQEARHVCNATSVAFFGAYTYGVQAGGTATVLAYSGEGEELILPAVMNGYPVTAVQSGVFRELTALRDVYYAGDASQWEAIAIGDDNTPLTDARLHCGTNGAHWEVSDTVYDSTCTEPGEETIVCACGYTDTRPIPSLGHRYTALETVTPTCTSEGYTVYQCDECDDIITDDVLAPAHSFRDNVCIHCRKAVDRCLTSLHDYESYTDEEWWVRQSGASEIALTFAQETETEEDYDVIRLYDGEGTCVGEYSGTALAGQTVTVSGDTARILFTSDGGTEYYGFAVVDVSPSLSVETGDMSGDGTLNMMDALLLFGGVNGGRQLTPEQEAVADVSGDGVLNMMDALLLFKQVSGA